MDIKNKKEFVLRHRNGIERNIAVFINPISGKGKSIKYFNSLLKPMLESAKIKFTGFETTSPTFMDEWVQQFNLKTSKFTEFIMIGGDGLLSQFMNAVGDHPDKDSIFKMPVGIMPGGSTNATS